MINTWGFANFLTSFPQSKLFSSWLTHNKTLWLLFTTLYTKLKPSIGISHLSLKEYRFPTVVSGCVFFISRYLVPLLKRAVTSVLWFPSCFSVSRTLPPWHQVTWLERKNVTRSFSLKNLLKSAQIEMISGFPVHIHMYRVLKIKVWVERLDVIVVNFEHSKSLKQYKFCRFFSCFHL